MSDAKKVNKLTDLNIDEVSLVDRGANQHASLVISKRAEDADEDEVEKMDPDMSDMETGVVGEAADTDGLPPDDDDDDIEENITGDKKKGEKQVEKGYFSRLIEKMFPPRDEELTTGVDEDGTLSSMSNVDKARHPTDPFGQQAQMPFGQQAQGAPAPGPQNFMPPGQQAFPAGQPQMPQQQVPPQQIPGMPGQQQMPGQMQAGPPLPNEVVQYIQQLEQALADAQGSDNQNQPSGDEEKNVNPFGKSAENLDEDEVTFLQELAKNLEDEDNREAISKAMEIVEKANARAEEAETIAKTERDFRLNQEYVAKARSMVNLPVSADEFGPVLKRLHDAMEEEDVAVIEKALRAANETIAEAGTFTEIGKRGGQGFEAVSKLDSKAKELVEKSDEPLSMEQARAQVMETDPSLYDEYLQETGR